MLGPAVLDEALATLEKNGPAAIGRSRAAYRVLLAGLRWRSDEGRLSRFLELLPPVIDHHLKADPSQLAPIFEDAAAVVPDGGAPAVPAMPVLAETLLAQWDALAKDARPAALSLALALAESSPEIDSASGGSPGQEGL